MMKLKLKKKFQIHLIKKIPKIQKNNIIYTNINTNCLIEQNYKTKKNK